MYYLMYGNNRLTRLYVVCAARISLSCHHTGLGARTLATIAVSCPAARSLFSVFAGLRLSFCSSLGGLWSPPSPRALTLLMSSNIRQTSSKHLTTGKSARCVERIKISRHFLVMLVNTNCHIVLVNLHFLIPGPVVFYKIQN